MMRCGDEIKLTVTKPNPMKLAPLPLMARQSIHVWFPTMYHTYFDICTGYTLRVRISHFIFAAPWPRNQFTSERTYTSFTYLTSYHGNHFCIFAFSPTHYKILSFQRVQIIVSVLQLCFWSCTCGCRESTSTSRQTDGQGANPVEKRFPCHVSNIYILKFHHGKCINIKLLYFHLFFTL